MKYHLMVSGHVIKENLSKSKAFEYFDLIRLSFKDVDVAVICTPDIAYFEEDESI